MDVKTSFTGVVNVFKAVEMILYDAVLVYSNDVLKWITLDWLPRGLQPFNIV